MVRGVMSSTTTEGIRVTVKPELLGRAQRAGERPVRLHATRCEIANEGTAPAQLRSRHWVITDANGQVEEVRGEGVVGKQPRLGPGERFEYTSWAMLRTPFGTMRGSYTMERPDGSQLRGADRRVRAHPAPRAALMRCPLPQKALLLVNLGTPDAPETGAVRRYLREFLERPAGARHPPGRPRGCCSTWSSCPSARQERRGLPEDLDAGGLAAAGALPRAGAAGSRTRSGRSARWSWRCATATRRSPRRWSALRARGVQELIVVPLYPQYASSSTGSTLERVYEAGRRGVERADARGCCRRSTTDPGFLDAFAEVARPGARRGAARTTCSSASTACPSGTCARATRPGAHCLGRADCCDVQVPANRYCYRAQSFFTARALAERLGLSPGKWTVTFQSRLGRTPWIQPYTDLVLPELARGGVKRLAVICPAFVADCLETLEEIGIRARDQFLAHGGEALTLVPSLNAHPSWVRGLVQMVRQLRGDEPATGAAA